MKERLTKKEICCLIITFNPGELLKRLVDIIWDQVDKIIIVDNNSEGEPLELLLNIFRDEKIYLIHNNKNFGIAQALNIGVSYVIKLNYDWVITFDQDSIPNDNFVDLLTEVYWLYPEKDKIGAIGANYPENNLKIRNINYKKIDYLITSGCLLSVNAFRQIGGFREDFFIDNVDLEYSLRLRMNKKVLLITKDFAMLHSIGDSKTYNLNLIHVKSSNHNYTRRYYMARNHIILSKKYILKFPYFISKLNFFFFLSLVKIIVVENDKKKKVIASCKGLLDGMLYSKKS
jgi:rhamnosyltransferase